MAKKRPAGTELEAPNEAQETLAGILQSFDNFGVSMVEADWRAMSETENNLAIVWNSARRVGTQSPLPIFLHKFATPELLAEQERYSEAQRAFRRVLCPCVFAKPSFDKSEEGDETVRMKLKIPDSHMSGSTAREFLGKTRLRIEFSRRPIGEWDQMELTDGPRKIITCETEVPSFGWSDGNWSFPFLISAEKFCLEDAIDAWKKQGSVRMEVIGEAIEGDDSDGEDEAEAPASEPKKRGRPKKETPAAGPKLFDGADPQTFAIGLTDKFELVLKTCFAGDGKFSARWSGRGPTGSIEQVEQSLRVSEIEAAVASVGNAIDFWAAYDDAESVAISAALKKWLAELSAGKTPAVIETESESW